MEATTDQRAVYIYALTDDTGIRYVGQTRQPLELRLTAHLDDARTWSAAKATWITSLRARGLQPEVLLLETTDVAGANEAERDYIREARRQGCDLVNGKLGGARQGGSSRSANARLTFGRRLRARRRLRLLTQTEFAALLGTTHAQVSLWETGKAFPSRTSLQRLCDALGVEPSALLGSTEETV